MQQILGPIGLVNMALQTFGLQPIQALMYTNVASAIGLVYLWIPFMLVAIYLSLLNFDFQLLEVAKVCGAQAVAGVLGDHLAAQLDGHGDRHRARGHPDARRDRDAALSRRPERRALRQHPRASVRRDRHLGARLGHGRRAVRACRSLVIGLIWQTVNLSRAGFTGALE